MTWIPKDDIFRYRFEKQFQDIIPKKSTILSISACVFDPLGLLDPISVTTKMLLQEIWQLKLDWDESIPMSLTTSWSNFTKNLQDIHTIEVPRYTYASGSSRVQIHGFADASSHAYGCCLHVRALYKGKIQCQLLAAKAEVAPLKTKTIPRLELCAATMLAQFWSSIKHVLDHCRIKSVDFWTDSEITLHWINTSPSMLATFVAIRIATVQELSQRISWQHVPTKFNPADIASRGCTVQELKDSLWFNGPSFLLENEEHWPKIII